MFSVTFRNRSRAFTLIELLVVITIIALLTSLATTSYITAQRNSRDNARKVKINTVANGVETYYRVNQKFPGQTGKGTAPNYPTSAEGCELYDVSTNGFVYAYYPTDLTSNTAPQQACNLRNNGAVMNDLPNGYTFDPTAFKPYPNWIPGLGDYVNPMPSENRYLDSAGGETGSYDLGNDPFNTATNIERTYVYRKLSGGYLLYTTLENNTDRDITSPQTFTDSPKYPTGTNIQLFASNVYMIRK